MKKEASPANLTAWGGTGEGPLSGVALRSGVTLLEGTCTAGALGSRYDSSGGGGCALAGTLALRG